jgi:ATP-dependent helicase/nuclease subunit A
VPQTLAGLHAADADFSLVQVPHLLPSQLSNVSVEPVDTAQAATQNIADTGSTTDSAINPDINATEPADDSTHAIGSAMHRLLEWAPTGVAAHTISAIHRQAAAREFALSDAQGLQAAQMAQRILQGQAAWAWNSEQVDWYANEVALAHHSQIVRLDRLVRHRTSGVWWVLDYKSTGQPLAQPELMNQLRRYRAAVQAAQPTALVQAAFLTPDGAVLELPVV